MLYGDASRAFQVWTTEVWGGDTAPAQVMTKRVLIVSYHFYPDAAVGARRMSELVRYLCRQGVEVVVVSAKSDRFIKRDPQLMLDFPNLRCIRVVEPPKLLPLMLPPIRRLLGRRKRAETQAVEQAAVNHPAPQDETRLRRWKRLFHSLEHLVDTHKLWATLAAARLTLLAFGEPFDAVISSGPPMSAHLAVLLARPLLRSHWVMDLRDPWCDQDYGRPDLHSSVSCGINRVLERRAFASADDVSVTTPGYLKLLRGRYPVKRDHIHLVLNGFDGDVELSPPPQGKLELLYAGSLYYNRDPFPLFRAIARLVSRPGVDRDRVRFRLFGLSQSWGGVDLTAWVAQQGLQDCISVNPPVAAVDVRRLMAQANVLVNFAQGQPLQIPAKMFDCLAACREMLLITEADSDSAWLGRQTDCGHVVAPEDVAGMEAALAMLYDKYANPSRNTGFKESTLSTYSRARQNEQFLELLKGVVVARREVSP